ncbi:ribose ABC transporter permease [Aliagarivorans marinus]|uniref:ribose ABC transporter permease n=1 Tax=Aliagarivorans marinus TaxID=561965 RepID=UPI00041F2E28|nr:ribose ABC transporter permease [Aliagarivorans marinus]
MNTVKQPTAVSGKPKVNVAQWLFEQKALIALLVLIVIVSFLNDNFFTTHNLLNILRQTSVNAVIAVGMTLVILTAGIDLSVGSILALCGALAASMVAAELPLVVTICGTLLAGCAMGMFSGVLVAKGKVQPFIATLVAMTALRGLTMVYTDGRPISTGFTDAGDAFAYLGTGYLFGIPFPVWLMVFAFAGAWYLLNHTRLGRYIYAVGGNEEATRLSGINVDRVKIAVYGISGLMSGLAGLIVTSRLSSAQPTAGAAYELDAIAAVVVGGTSLAGGRGWIIGTLIGALIIGFLNNALNLLDVSSYYQMIAKAAVILLAVLADRRSK